MRLKHVYISNYKNLKEFSVDLSGENFIDIFVGKNGGGKSNFFEALMLIFRHLYEFRDDDATIYEFDYKLSYEINGHEMVLEWKAAKLKVNGRPRKTLSGVQLPDNILVYYSGQNNTITEILTSYEMLFSKKIKGSIVNDIRKFIGIGHEYKELLLSLILIQPEGSKSKEFLTDKLGIKNIGSELKLKLKRPNYALEKAAYDIVDNDNADNRYWGARGISKDFLESLRECISPDKSNRARAEGYQGSDDTYIHYYDIDQLSDLFADKGPLYLFRMLDNLQLIGMLEQVSIGIELDAGYQASISDFSDGQFQSIYIYAITEMFKESNCLTLLDEPDAFLHPEWQFEFLSQVDEISKGAAKTNHVLMSSHSAITLIPYGNSKVKFLDLKGSFSNCYELPKRVAVNKLSSDIIKYSEQEQLLSILYRIKIENKPILFTEGHTDAKIITEAWRKLYDEEMPFEPFYAFSCTFINNLIRDRRIHSEMHGKPVFALFDFDLAYSQWDGLQGEVVSNVLSDGLVKKWDSGNAYAIMLPVPNNPDIQKQVIKDADKQYTFGDKSCCEIEHLFYGIQGTEGYFKKEISPGGQLIKFSNDGEKVEFSENIVPAMDVECFEVFRPIFEFIKSKIPVSNEAVA